jgi:hypothetical protein
MCSNVDRCQTPLLIKGNLERYASKEYRRHEMQIVMKPPPKPEL